jgi:hypothetical protein
MTNFANGAMLGFADVSAFCSLSRSLAMGLVDAIAMHECTSNHTSRVVAARIAFGW